MEKELLNFLAGERKVSRQGHELRILTAWEMMQANREAEEMDKDPQTAGMRRNACILSRAAIRGDVPLFSSGEAVLKSWSGEKIGEEMKAYRALAKQTDPSCTRSEQMEILMRQLRQEPMERIRWKVLKTFGVLPSEQRAKNMTEGDYLYCAMQLMLDREQRLMALCPDCRSRAAGKHCACCGGSMEEEGESNPQFDRKRFEEMRHSG